MDDNNKKHDLQPGEKIFTGILLLIGMFFFYHSVILWGNVNPPRESSAAVVPLVMTTLWVALTGIIFVKNIKKTTPLSNLSATKDKILSGLEHIFPLDVIVMIGAIAIYCALLLFGISFYITTGAFLYLSMCYLMKSGYIKNILWTSIFLAFVVVVFGMVFNVMFP